MVAFAVTITIHAASVARAAITISITIPIPVAITIAPFGGAKARGRAAGACGRWSVCLPKQRQAGQQEQEARECQEAVHCFNFHGFRQVATCDEVGCCNPADPDGLLLKKRRGEETVSGGGRVGGA